MRYLKGLGVFFSAIVLCLFLVNNSYAIHPAMKNIKSRDITIEKLEKKISKLEKKIDLLLENQNKMFDEFQKIRQWVRRY